MSSQQRPLPAVPVTGDYGPALLEPLDALLGQVARGDQDAFAELYDRVAGQVYGLVRHLLRDPAEAEEVTQEVLVEVWRSAPHFDPGHARAATWIMSTAHRRAVDRSRAAHAMTDRDERVGRNEHLPALDEVVERQTRLEPEQVRHALSTLTALQREAVTLAYFGGYTCGRVSELLDVPLGTAMTRLRDGLILLRDAMAVRT